MNKQSSKSSRSATSVGVPAGRASFARLVSSLILALSALAGLFSPQRGLSITHKCLGDCRACRASIARLPRCQQGGEILAR